MWQADKDQIHEQNAQSISFKKVKGKDLSVFWKTLELVWRVKILISVVDCTLLNRIKDWKKKQKSNSEKPREGLHGSWKISLKT